jgi:hypothetical protein
MMDDDLKEYLRDLMKIQRDIKRELNNILVLLMLSAAGAFALVLRSELGW